MFKGDDNKNQAAETIIGQSVKVEGDFIGDGNVVVAGSVVGNLKTKNNLKVGPQAKIQAEVSAENAQIAGEIVGNVTIGQYLEIQSSANITGNISAGVISIEKGAKVNGQLKIEANNSAE